MKLAVDIGQRSVCVRAQYGAVVVTDTNDLVATGYNGFPAGLEGTCDSDCPRAHLEVVPRDYSNCYALHCEANCLLRADPFKIRGGTMYISGLSCWDCAKLVSNSGVRRAVLLSEATTTHGRDIAHRRASDSIDLMLRSGLQVVTMPPSALGL